MQIAIRTIGNSKGVVLPKPILSQIGLAEDTIASLTVEDGAVVLRKVDRAVRKGWEEAAQKLAAHGCDDLLMGEFGNDADAEIVW